MELFVSGEDLTAIESGAASATESERGVMAKALAAPFAAGATLAMLTIALPHSKRASDLGLLVIVGIAYVIAAALYWRAQTFPSGAADGAVIG
jgi:hypothetical protein